MNTMATIDTDSKDARKKAYEKLTRFVSLAGIEQLDTPEKKVEWLQHIEFHKFMDLLSVSNGILTTREKFQRWTGKGVVSRVKNGNGEIVELEPPRNAEQELEKIFRDMQEHLTVENVHEYAARIYLGIIFAHLFPDGNGRIARYTYALLKGEHKKDEVILSRAGEIVDVADAFSSEGIKKCFEQRGLLSLENGEYPQASDRDSASFDVGAMASLKYLAVFDLLKERGKEHTMPVEHYELTPEKERRDDFQEAYAKVRKEWFWNIQEATKNQDYSKWLCKNLDKALGY